MPPREFSRARRALASRLDKGGQGAVASRIRKLKRPTIPVWIVNRLAREERPTIEKLITTADRMRAAQLGRTKAADALPRAAREHHAALAHLVDGAARILEEAGLGGSHRVLLRIENTLEAAVADPATQAALREGGLERELAVRGFDVFGGARPERRSRPAKERARGPQRTGKSRAGRAPRRAAPLTGT